VVTKIFPASASQMSEEDWGVTIQVESVTRGKYKLPEFTFAVHSPTISGLVVGARYTVVAQESRVGYVVDESQWVKRGEAQWSH
jgi:hypothetical protein